MRATRDLLRRRMHLARKRAELLAHVHHTHRQDHLPAIGKKIAYKANRDGVAERVDDAVVHKTIEVDFALIPDDDALLRELARSIIQTAKQHEANTLHLRQTVPGRGTILGLVRLYDIHHIARFPRVQDVASYGRLVTCAKASAGTRVGTSGKNVGHAHLTWAFAEAAVLCLRHTPQGQPSLGRLEKQHDKGKALTILAHQLARAVYDLRKRHTAFDRDMCLRA